VEKVSFEPGMMSVTRKKHIVAIRSDHPRLCVYCICIFVVFWTTKSRYTHEFMRLPPRSCRSVVLNWSLVQISAFVGSYLPLNRITEFSGDISGMIAWDLTEVNVRNPRIISGRGSQYGVVDIWWVEIQKCTDSEYSLASGLNKSLSLSNIIQIGKHWRKYRLKNLFGAYNRGQS